MDETMQHRFTPTTFFVWGGLLIWAADFLFVYVFAAVACARRFADAEIAGLRLVPVATSLASIAASIATLVLILRAVRRAHGGDYVDESSRFIQFLAIALGALALVAIAWTALPPLMLRSDSLACI
jgi:hypothetical protein